MGTCARRGHRLIDKLMALGFFGLDVSLVVDVAQKHFAIDAGAECVFIIVANVALGFGEFQLLLHEGQNQVGLQGVVGHHVHLLEREGMLQRARRARDSLLVCFQSTINAVETERMVTGQEFGLLDLLGTETANQDILAHFRESWGRLKH
jgi:hypothetical protein